MPGFFITLEGIDGAGKSTQAVRLAQWLRGEGWCVVLTRQPGGTPLGERLRELVLAPENHMVPEAELFLYLADRAIHVAEVIRPALARGCVVVCERYTDSTLAYQGYGRGLEVDLLRRLNELATGGLRPDLTLVLDLPPERARLDALRLDRLESAGQVFAQRVAEGFSALARAEPERVKLVDATPGVGAVQQRIAALVREALARARSQEAS